MAEQRDLLGDVPPADKVAKTGDKLGPGRPTGSRNKRTDQLMKLIAHQYGTSPAEKMATIAFAEPHEISKKYGIPIERAFGVMLRALVELMPYCHQKLPTMVEVVNERHIVLQLGKLGGYDAVDGDGLKTVLDLRPANVKKQQQNQGTSISSDEKSDDNKSDARL